MYNDILQKAARYHAFEKLKNSQVYEETKTEDKMEVDQSNLQKFDSIEFIEH
jgi:hypothetical protein